MSSRGHQQHFPSHDVEHVLDSETGEIIPLYENFEDYDELSERLEADLGGRYRRIEPFERPSPRPVFVIKEPCSFVYDEGLIRARS